MELELTQDKTALIDDEDWEKVKTYKWFVHREGDRYYAWAHIKKSKPYKKIKMHRLILNVQEDKQVDHVNMNGLDNRKINLRICDRSQNGANRTKYNCNKSGFKGVDLNQSKWRASIRKDNKTIFLGRFLNREDAAKTYDAAARQLFGDFARGNF